MDDKANLLKTIKKTSNARLRLRYIAVLNFLEGKSRSVIAHFLKVRRGTVNDWITIYLNEGLEGLEEKPRSGRPPKLTDAQKKQLSNYVDSMAKSSNGGRLIGKDLVDYIQKHFGITYSVTSVYNILHKLGFSWITSRSKHPKQSEEQQENFKKKFHRKVIEAIPGHIHLSRILVWFQDEARFGQRNTTTRLWAKKGTRPRAVKQQENEYAYCFGAVCMNTGQTEAIISPYLNRLAMEEHLKLISRATPCGMHSVVIVDNASWHQSELADLFDNITLIHLPPYSPELNSIEQVWNWLRQHCLANRCFEDYEDIKNAVCNAWNDFRESTQRVISISTRKWAKMIG